MPTIQLSVKGKVQGVFYRATAKEKATVIGITGYIRNMPSGDVEAVVSGTKRQLQDFINWCKKGPEKAVVHDVEVTTREDIPFEKFMIVR